MNNNAAVETKNEVRKSDGATGAAVEKFGRELNSSARQVGSAIKEAGLAVGHDVSEAAQGSYDSIIASGREGAKQLESKVQESPLLAIGVAFAVGLVTSALFFRRV